MQAATSAIGSRTTSRCSASPSPTSCSRRRSAKSRHKDAVADIALMPGVGEGKPPPLLPILREHGVSPLVLLTMAAIVPSTFGNGINLIGNNLESSFHLHDSGLGAVTFVAAVAQLAVGGAAGAVGRPRAAARSCRRWRCSSSRWWHPLMALVAQRVVVRRSST